jgi:hypothetical protein
VQRQPLQGADHQTVEHLRLIQRGDGRIDGDDEGPRVFMLVDKPATLWDLAAVDEAEKEGDDIRR